MRGRERLRIEHSEVGKRPLSPLIRDSGYQESRISTGDDQDDEYEILGKRDPRRERYHEPHVLAGEDEYDIPVKRRSRRERRQDSYYEKELSPILKYNEPSETRFADEQDRRQRGYRRDGDEHGSATATQRPAESNEENRGRMRLSRDDSFGSNSSSRSQQRRQERLHPDE